MTTYNSIRPVHYLLYLILFIITGCVEKPNTHAFLYEKPAVFNPDSVTSSVYTQANFNRYHKQFNLLPSSHKTVWGRLLSLYALPVIDNDRIDREIQRYLDHPEYLTTIQQRAEPYLYFILDQIESKQIPGELALLPVVESAFKTNAISKSKASGLWQFMPATGRFFGLKQNWWYDGRNDIYTSTQAATTYLSQLSKLFDDDWLLALAAYNAGKGTIRKAINRNMEEGLETDYWSLSLSKETMDYVPRLLAIARIFANTDKYNIPLQPFPNKPYFAVVDIESQLDLTLATEMAQISTTDFFTLNPAFKRSSTDPDGPFHLLIHVNKADTFKEKLAQTQKKDRIKWIRHKIKSGENLGVIAKKYDTGVKALRQVNHLANNNIRAGHFLLIPTSMNNSNAVARITNKLAQSQKKDGLNWTRHKIKSGENLGIIARKYHSSVEALRQGNHLADNNIRAGHFLLIPTSMNNSNAVATIANKLAQPQKKDGLNWTRHKIKSGENLGVIARKYHTSIEALRQGNHLASNNITAGQFLLIPNSRNNSNTLATIANNQLYIVKKGDTFWDIARQFDVTSRDIANWNNISLNNVLQPGQKLIIKKS